MAFDDVVRALTSVVRPWSDLHAVKTTQVDIVKAVAGQHSDLAAARASVDRLSQDVARLSARNAEQDEEIRLLRARLDAMQRETPGEAPQARAFPAASMAEPAARD